MHSRWPEVYFLTCIDSANVINCLKKLFSREGFPKTILMDNGVQLVLKDMEQFLMSSGIIHKTCSLYHPEANGMVERLNRVLKETITLAKS